LAPALFGLIEGIILTKRRLACLLCATLIVTGCATTENHTSAPSPPAPLPPPSESAKPVAAIPQKEIPANADATDALIKQVDALYTSGMNDFHAGNLEKSKQEFDQALGTLLQSGMDIQGDEQLSSEFDKIVENVYSVESASLGHGDALSLHNYEPTPLESFSGLTFPVDPRTTQRVREELKSVQSDLPLVSNDAVDGVIAYLQTRSRGFIENVLRRKGTYGEIISDALRKQGVPQDLIYLAAGESAFNPYAVSNKACVGIWQFSQGTGGLYGLKKNRWEDDRLDPAKSSAAAAHHLKDLYTTFGDWFLVMAAYDSGPLTVQRAIERTGYADYWELRRVHALPTETENYVPIFLATALIAKDPKAYGFDTQPDPPLAVDLVEVTSPTDLRLVAGLIDHPVDEIAKINPSLLGWTTPADESSFVLYLPTRTKDLYDRNIALVPPSKRLWWRAHKVLPGETLADIARDFHVTTLALTQANQLTVKDIPDPGVHLAIPLPEGNEASLARFHAPVRPRLALYRVRPGDTVDLIADRFNVTPYQLRRWNGLRSAKLAPGRTLHIYQRGQVAASTHSVHSRSHAGSSHSSAHAATAPKKTSASTHHTAPATATAAN
jgi:membrane-bound lytic murein transglycosylase D